VTKGAEGTQDPNFGIAAALTPYFLPFEGSAFRRLSEFGSLLGT
jgi:hypothetical protein